jgi:hypothetical protein
MSPADEASIYRRLELGISLAHRESGLIRSRFYTRVMQKRALWFIHH